MRDQPSRCRREIGFDAKARYRRQRQVSIDHAWKGLCQRLAKRVLHDIVLEQARPAHRRQNLRGSQQPDAAAEPVRAVGAAGRHGAPPN